MEKRYSSYWKTKLVVISLVLIHFACPLIATGQHDFVNEYLLSALEDSRVTRRSDERSYLENNSMKPSWIREAEIRMRTSRYNNPFDDYRFRISPANPWEIKANKSYQNQLAEVTGISYDIAVSKATKSRYLNLIQSYFLEMRSNFTAEELKLKKLRSEQLFNIKNQISTDDLLNTESDISHLEIENAELALKLMEINHVINQSVKSTVNWQNWQMISPESISNFILTHDTSVTKNLYKELASQEMDLEKKLYQINKTEAFSNIGFLQADMDLNQGDDFSDHLGFQVGVSLPIINRDKADLSRDRFDMIEKQSDTDFTKKAIDEEVSIIMKRIQSLYKMYQLVDEKIKRSEMMSASLTNTHNEFTLYKHKAYQLELQSKQLEIHESILQSYIDYLDIQGMLVAVPVINYLSQDLTEVR